MLERIKSLMPQRLKYRLFTAFLILILLPFSALNFYNYQRIESVIQNKISEKSHDQLKRIIQSLEDLMGIAFKTWILLEQDTSLKNVLQSPENQSALDNKRIMEDKFISINNSLFLYNPVVYYTIIDLKGNMYSSYQPRKPMNYQSLISGHRFQEVLHNKSSLSWDTNDTNDVSQDMSTSKSLLSLYTLFKNASQNYEPFGAAKISIDYSAWFKSVHQEFNPDQDFFMIAANGEVVAQSLSGHALSPSSVARITKYQNNGYFIDTDSSSIINYSYINSLDWYMVNSTPLAILFNEIDSLKKQYYVTFFVLMAAFILFTFMISSSISNQLSHLQRKLKDVVHTGLKIRLPQNTYNGEILELSQTFNKMLDDMNALIQRLKEEERQKEAVHFQMLLAQVNPHFLLNTLNTMKWIAIRRGEEDIQEMCVSLGKLLEMSLNTDIDMIHLQEEIDLVKAYVHIQQARFNYHLDVSYTYDSSIAYALVPKLSIQPLVENAIQHGIAHIADKGRIDIKIYKDSDNYLNVEVRDNGIGLSHPSVNKPTRKRSGIGIKNIKERLFLLFKERGVMEVIPQEQGTLAVFRFPFLLSVPYINKDQADLHLRKRSDQ